MITTHQHVQHDQYIQKRTHNQHSFTMQQQIGNLVPLAITRPCPRLPTADGGGRGSSGHRVVRLGRPANLGMVTAHAYPKSRRLQGHATSIAPPKSCLLQDAPIAAPKSCLLQDAPTINMANQHTNSIRKEKFFEVEMIVRDDDLDEYGVVNNAIYASYIHSGRDVLLETLGISVYYWTSTGNAMALSELNLKYFAPLRRGDRFVVKLRVVQVKGVRIIVDHLIETLPDRKLVLEARATAVCLDKNYRPTRVFPELSSKIRQFFSP